ncbi:hypothetical protein GCM10023238_24110 [Streptomyces heliomycini]
MADKAAEAAQVIEDVPEGRRAGVGEPRARSYVVKLPAPRKLSTTVSLIAAAHAP